MATGFLCLVAVELDFLYRNGGIGTSNWQLIQLLARHGWRVHVLHAGHVDDPEALPPLRRRLAEAGIGLTLLEETALPRFARVPGYPACASAERSDHVRMALEQLHQCHGFDLIQFAEWQGLGFRALQAKQAGRALSGAGVVVKLHSMSPWLREGGQRWPSGPDELLTDFAERRSFELADFQIGASRCILDYARALGWQLHPDAQVVPNPLPDADFPPAPLGPQAPRELVFFGRLQPIKGLDVFLDAVADLDPALALTFLGKDTVLANGQLASACIRARLPGRNVRLLTDCNRLEALRYLSQGDRLAVLPSRLDNYPNAVLECAVNGIPFLAAHVGGIPEIIAAEELQGRLLFAPTARDLRRCLTSYLQADQAHRRAWRDAVLHTLAIPNHNQRIVDFYAACLPQVRLKKTEHRSKAEAIQSAPSCPPVTVAVTYYNLGAYLPEALASLAAQTYPNLEVLVLDDGSTEAASLQVFAEQQRVHPQFHFHRQDNAGLSAARNRCLELARGDYFLPFDADNVATPAMVDRLVTALQSNPHCSAMSSYYLGFKETADIWLENFASAYRPTGGPHVLGAILNVYGDASALFRTADLRAVGGYEPDRDTTMEDWEVLLKLLHAGFALGVVPEYLYYYRLRPDSLLRTTNAYRNHQRVLRQYFRRERLRPADEIEFWSAWVGLTQRCTQLENQLHEQHGTLQRCQSDLDASRARVLDLERRLDCCQGEADADRARVRNLEQNLHCCQVGADDDRARVRALEEQLGDCQGEADAGRARVRALEEQLGDCQGEVDAGRARVCALEEQLGDCQGEAVVARARVCELEEQLRQLRFRVADRVNSWLKKVPLLHGLGKGLLRRNLAIGRALRHLLPWLAQSP